MKAPLVEREGWDGVWTRLMSRYTRAVPRTGVFVERLAREAGSCLELGAGSARDSLYLAARDRDALASDFSPGAVAEWSRLYGERFAGRVLDAFAIDAPDRAFDVSFHNGLYVLFDDEQIVELAAEQRRVTARTMIVIVHNARNRRLETRFRAMAESDPVYRIRFFDPDEIVALLVRSGTAERDLTVRKFGGPADYLYRLAGASAGAFDRCHRVGRLVVPLYAAQPWSRVERVAVIARLGGASAADR